MISAALRRLVRRRAGDRCEYCRLPQSAVDITFHVEHVIARQHGGLTQPQNLALACDRCNLYKGTNLTAIDPETGEIQALFNPRRQAWDTHMALHGIRLRGRTPTGRATVRLLQMNSARRRRLRALLIKTGQF
ncbi:MAG: HNH endonuclease [Planctomycetia bacterium]|nr:HNH endonuclease [Planctomycetia bacterium]